MNTPHSSLRHTLASALVLAFPLLSSCDSNHEEQAQEMLQQARLALKHKQYAEAKDSILSLRIKHPTAIQARRQGILLLDSIEMYAADDSMQRAEGKEWERLNVKKRFFERKLQEDCKRAAREERENKD